MNDVADLRGIHQGERVTIFGKGPGLDDFDAAAFNGVGICINHSIRVVPQATYYVGCGKGVLRELTGVWQGHHRVIVEHKCSEWAWASGISPQQSYGIETSKGLMKSWSIDRFARGEFYSVTSNAQVAVSLALLMGAGSIRLVGCEGGRHWAKSVRCGTTRHDYTKCRAYTEKLLDHFGVEYEFWTPRSQVA